MKIQALGHVVLKVTNLKRAEAFYGGVLGLPVCAHYDKNGMRMAFYSLGNHHDFAVMEVSGEGSATAPSAVGLAHVAFKIGDDMSQLREAKAKFDAAGIATQPVDHFVTKSIYIHDPDGNEIELYVDAADDWKRDPECIAVAEPMEL